MKIDYDKPVKGRLIDGDYLAVRGPDKVLCKIRENRVIPMEDTVRWLLGLKVSDWRHYRFKFYRAKPKRGRGRG